LRGVPASVVEPDDSLGELDVPEPVELFDPDAPPLPLDVVDVPPFREESVLEGSIAPPHAVINAHTKTTAPWVRRAERNRRRATISRGYPSVASYAR
jgi:hypothetical protein